MDKTPTETTSSQPEVQPMTSTVTTKPTGSSNKKPWLPWVIVAAIVVVVVIAALAIVGVMRSNANSAAHDYTSATTSYLNDYANKIIGSSSPSDAKSSVKSLSAPKLKSVPLGSTLSSDYKKAQDNSDKVAKTVDDVNKQLDQYVTVEKFVDGYKVIVNKAEDLAADSPSSLSEASSWLDKFSVLVADAKKQATDFNAPSELKSARQDLINAVSGEQTDIAKMKSAINAKNQDAYYDAIDQMSSDASDEDSALSDIQNFMSYDSNEKLANKLDDLRKQF